MMHEPCMYSAGSSDYIRTCRQEEGRRWEVGEGWEGVRGIRRANGRGGWKEEVVGGERV